MKYVQTTYSVQCICLQRCEICFFNKIADSHPVRGAARYVVGLYHRVNAGGMLVPLPTALK